MAWRTRKDPELDLVANRKGSDDLELDWQRGKRVSNKLGKKLRCEGLYIGNDGLGREMYSTSAGGILLVAGARTGKLIYILCKLINGGYQGDMTILDPKEAELAYHIKKLSRRHIVIFMTKEYELLGVTASANVWSHFKPGLELVGLVRIATADFLGISQNENVQFFKGGGKENWLTPVIVADVELNGGTNVPRIAHLFSEFKANTAEWAGFEYDAMLNSPHGFVRAAAAAFKEARTNGYGHGGQEGQLAEVTNSLVSMNDPLNRRMVSPPYTFDFDVLEKEPDPSDPTDWPYTIVIAVPKLQITQGNDAPLVRAMMSRIMHAKRSAPLSRQMVTVCEEAGNLAPWPGLVHAFTESAGLNCRPVVVLQSPHQGDLLAPDGFSDMSQSASAHVAFGLRDPKVADPYAQRMGHYQVQYKNEARVAELRLRRRQARREMLAGNGAAMQVAREMKIAEEQFELETRPVRYGSELINKTPSDRGYVWADEWPGCLYASFEPMWKTLKPGEYNDCPLAWHITGQDRITVCDRFGRKITREMIEIDPPEEFQDAFHFRHGAMPCRVVKGVKYD